MQEHMGVYVDCHHHFYPGKSSLHPASTAQTLWALLRLSGYGWAHICLQAKHQPSQSGTRGSLTRHVCNHLLCPTDGETETHGQSDLAEAIQPGRATLRSSEPLSRACSIISYPPIVPSCLRHARKYFTIYLLRPYSGPETVLGYGHAGVNR